jgi:hypothetical protein
VKPVRELGVRALVALALASVFATGCGGGGGDGADDALGLGRTAVVEYTPTTSSGAPGKATTLAVMVTAVRRGTQEELSKGGIEVDAEDRDSIPHYIDARFENRGQAPVDRNLDLSLEGPDGETLPRTVLFDYGGKPFKPCRNVTDGRLAPGETYEACTLVLVPEGDDVETVLFTSQKADNEIVFTRWDAGLD